MAEIAPELVDRMMVKCGRRCCICRRFKPTLLQCHHIQLQSQGGTDDEENLIVLCLTCHTDVHSKVPFTRRFSHAELKGHRDALVAMVAQGNLPDDESALVNQIVGAIRNEQAQTGSLSSAAADLLLQAVNAPVGDQGIIRVVECEGFLLIAPGNQQQNYGMNDHRRQAEVRAALQELENTGLVEHSSDSLRQVTYQGYLVADELSASLADVETG